MSGGYIPYHLRHNKSIDREVFLEGLDRLNKIVSIHDYTYIGFGGPMLEDFRHIHNRKSIDKLISIEEDEKVLKRQIYNQPFSCIRCDLKKSTDFITEYPFDTPTITWLDYASPKRIEQDLNDILMLSTKVSDSDILKVTFPINPDSICSRKNSEDIDLYKDRFLEALKSKLSKKYINFNLQITATNLSQKGIISFLSGVIVDAFKNAVERGLTNRKDNLSFIPLVLNIYNDGSHSMLTVFGIYKYKQDYRKTLEETGLNNWNFISKHWKDIQNISIPTLTIKEKIHLDSKLPNRKSYLEAANEICLEVNDVENYLKYYRLYPNFQRIMV